MTTHTIERGDRMKDIDMMLTSEVQAGDTIEVFDAEVATMVRDALPQYGLDIGMVAVTALDLYELCRQARPYVAECARESTNDDIRAAAQQFLARLIRGIEAAGKDGE